MRRHPRIRTGRRGAAAVALVAALAAATLATAADWPQFRGPDRTGVSPETGLLDSWPATGPPELWRVPLGEGYSGVSAVGGRLYTIYARGGDELLVCLDAADGRELWRYRTGPLWRDGMGNGPRSTPTVHDGAVYALGAHGALAAVDAATGEEIWRLDLKKAVGARPPTWGISASPHVEGDLVIVDAGGRSGHSVVAVDRASGELVWQAESDKAGYSAPIAVEVAGRRQVIVFTGTQVVALAPADGRLLWKRPWKTAYDVNAATPIFIAPNKLFVASGYSTGGALLRLDAAPRPEAGGPVVAVREIWSSKRMRSQFSSAVYVDGYLYGFDNSTLKCLDAATGEEQWAVREGFGHGSLTWADGHLYVLGDRGKLALVEASPEGYREKSSFEPLEGKCWTVPTISDGRLYVRNEKELVALDVRAASEPS